MRLRPDRKTERQVQAEARTKEWRALTPQQQIESLNNRRGNSLKQRTRILEKAAS